MTAAAFALNAMAGAAALAGGQHQAPETGMLNGGIFYDYYRTKDDRWLSVGSLEPQFSARLCETLGIGELKSLATSQNPEQQKTLKSAIKEKILEKTLSEWQEIFVDVDACVELVLTIEEAAEHPHLLARKMVVETDRGDGQVQMQLGCALR